jgi:DNA-binding transcriptional MerR regulator
LEESPDAFRTISEVAEEVNVPQHVLRFWESRFAQIRPLKRGGGRRYYRPDDVDLLRGVRHLLYGEGYTIRGVQRILREEGISFVQNVWRAGAQQPPPEAQEDGAEERDGAERDGAERGAARPDEPSFSGLLPSSPSAREPAPTAVAAPRRRINDADRHQLQAALDELVTCRRLISAALADATADDN